MGRKRKRSRVTRESRINVPERISKRWLNSHSGTEYRLGSAYSQGNVNSEKFKECWKTVQPTLSEEVLFGLFDGTFGSPGRCRKSNVERKVKFIKHILRLGLHPGTRTVERVRINVPRRIKKRWCLTHRQGTEFQMGQALSKVHVKAEEFKTCWKTVQPTLSEEDLFDLFHGAFGSGDDVNLKINFIKDILGRCKDPRMDMQETRVQVSSDDIETQTQISTGSCDGRYTKDQVKDQFFRDFNLDSWFNKHAASDGTVSQNQIDMGLVKHALSTITRIVGTYSR